MYLRLDIDWCAQSPALVLFCWLGFVLLEWMHLHRSMLWFRSPPPSPIWSGGGRSRPSSSWLPQWQLLPGKSPPGPDHSRRLKKCADGTVRDTRIAWMHTGISLRFSPHTFASGGDVVWLLLSIVSGGRSPCCLHSKCDDHQN